ncbi:MAG: putative portal protein [Prokaryotic dsDNA virus sp.]|nr:MAG: putative portal protein [Prokaryotic dsDNA virus sp.]
MKNNIISIDLGVETSPQVKEVHGQDYIEYGTDEWANLYPQFLIDLYYNSSTNAAIINATAEMISAEDIVIDDEDDNQRDLDAIVKLKKFFANANGKESLHEVIKKVSFDFKLQGAFALNIIWSQDRTEIAEIYHIPVEKLRCEKPNEMGQVKGYYISADWTDIRNNPPTRVPCFNINDRTSANQVLYSGLYSPNMSAYYTPDYLAGNNWSLIDQKVSEFHLNNIKNGFSGSYFISFANGVPTQEERLQIERSLTEKFTGSENAGKFILTFSDDKTRTPEITPVSVADQDKLFISLQELLVQNILTAHRVTSPMLMGIKNETGLGSNVDELNSAANFYLNTVVKPFQDHIIKVFRKLFMVNNMDMPISFVQLKPITLEFNSEDLKEVMTQEEIREELGLKPLENEEPEARRRFSKVGSMVTDGKEGKIDLPLYDTIEEAEEEAEKLGCKGYHEHTLDGETVYMPCEDHDQIKEIANLKTDCGCKEEFIEPNPCWEGYEPIGTKIKDGKEVPNCVPIKATKMAQERLKSFLAGIEDVPKDWELVDTQIVDGEHKLFDFEETLNSIANNKLELASTGTARPNARSKRDGVNKSFNEYFKVRYVYTEDKSLTNSSGKTRDFCRLMEDADKIYRKEDIIQMEKLAVNPGFGPDGSDTYDILLYKGGANCHHYWERRIYRTSLRRAKSKLRNADIISEAQAISDGFTLEKDDKLIITAPKKMKNNGYIKAR